MLVSTAAGADRRSGRDYQEISCCRKEGAAEIVGQVGLGIIVGTTMCALSPDIVSSAKVAAPSRRSTDADGTVVGEARLSSETTQTTIPLRPNNEFDYGWLTGGNSVATWILYVLVAIFVVTAVSNGANLTDGLDGLATGVSVPITS